MAEEQHRCQEQRLCVNNCGFYGCPATENLCSKCYRDLHQSQTLNHQLLNPQSSAAIVSSSSPAVDVLNLNTNQKAPVVVVGDDKKEEVKAGEPAAEKQQPNRCLECRRRVGLTGFKCRCGMVFCGKHRYPEQHGCKFDFKSLGKQQIAKANPVVKGEKLQKI
ncbi:ZINC FINGER A20 AND AN1 DOMAIN-CONTAINING STRESS-ASSOCIATED PROTEIN 3 [Salix purpurea]|uniref:ZINC FINGER A20 AND AN1 DOMAIN-CONTAINING STRESS-ASSOCIATED PROTEIN 3 n=1 Tax=Salix purpurea TaxID=77065 RepID=A0A9Q1AC97_SALPP|nr:ZINC FINGER A20 AND AN1 DOMAIN-CONTAINING STRESS-ASSOCIATED PROTEIN 3 [Salix purpurea]